MFCTEVSFPNSQLTSFTQFPVHFFFLWKDNCFTEFLLFSVSHQQESTTGIPLSPPSQTSSHLSPHPTLLDYCRAPVWIPGVMQQIPIGYLFYITAKIFRITRESIPRQGSWGGDRVWNSQGGGKVKLIFPLHSLGLHNNNVSCLRTVSGKKSSD